jgi:photosystem II stability/assembly factor-like uncharacterized protein
MKKFFRFFAVSLTILMAQESSHAQWVQTSGPGGGTVLSIVAMGNNVFAGTQNGVYVTTNGGTSWTSASNGLTSEDVYTLAVSGSNLLAGTGNGVFVSTNNGSTWTSSSSGLTFTRVNVLLNTGGTVYAGAAHFLFKSTDNGGSWTEATSDSVFGFNNISVLFASGSNLYAATTSTGVFRSSNNAASWTAIDSNVTNKEIESMTAVGNTLFLATFNKLYSSTNNGTVWNALSTGGLFPTYLGGAASFGGKVLMGGYFSADTGHTWTALPGFASYAFGYAVVGNKIFNGGSGAGVSADSGQTWTPINAGLALTNIYSLTAAGSDLYAGTSAGVAISTDEGASWTNTDVGAGAINAVAVNGTTIAAATSGNGISLSTDNGSTWNDISVGQPFMTGYAVAFSGSNLIVGTGGSGLYMTTDNGTDWTPLGFNDTTFTVLGVNGSTILAASSGQGTYRSTNNGSTWSKITAGLGDTDYVSQFAYVGSSVYVATQGYGVYRSTDNGVSWTVVGTGLLNADLSTPDVTSLVSDGTNLYAGDQGSSSAGVFSLLNITGTWHAATTGFTNKYITSLAIVGTQLFAGTLGAGVWSRSLAQLTTAVQESKSVLPTAFALAQNYPNPFNPSTTISYELPTNSRVTLKIFNLLGQEVATLVDGQQDAGSHALQWNAANVSSGVYFYRLQADNFSQTRKLLLLK